MKLPHMVEAVHSDGTLECDCGAVWKIDGDLVRLEEGNALCEMPTLYSRWKNTEDFLRRLGESHGR